MPDYTNVLNRAVSLETAPAFSPFTGVRLWYDDENAFFSGDETGRILEADCPWATQAIADSVLASVSGFAYRPFTAQSALLDPAAELGDGVNVGGVYSVLAAVDTNFDAMCASDISAPADEEIDHEYPYLTKQERDLARKVTLGADYYGTRITRKNGLEVVTTKADGTEASRVVLNSDTLAFYNDNGTEALFFDAAAGKYRFQGDVSITGGTMNINDNFIVDADGNLTINGNINLSGGSITWGKNDPADGVGISASQARTIISQELVSSPNIAGGKFWDIEQTNWVEMGEGGDGAIAYFNHYYSGYSSTEPIFVMGYTNPIGQNHQWLLAPFFKIRLTYKLSDDTMYANGNWDFSYANVTGLDGVGGDVTVTPVWG